MLRNCLHLDVYISQDETWTKLSTSDQCCPVCWHPIVQTPHWQLPKCCTDWNNNYQSNILRAGQNSDSFSLAGLYILILDWNDVSLPSHRWTNGWQPLKTIVTNGWMSDKSLKNGRHLSTYHSLNDKGCFESHWFLVISVKFHPKHQGCKKRID